MDCQWKFPRGSRNGPYLCKYLRAPTVNLQRLIPYLQGSLGDRLGKKWFLVGGALLGVVGSCISGSAHKITDVIGGNILTGIANAGCVSLASLLPSPSFLSLGLTRIFADRLHLVHPRNRAQ